MSIIRNTAILTLLFLLWNGNLKAFNIYSDFPGGNIIIDKIKNDTVWFRPDLRDTKGEWFYWYFAVNDAKGKNLTFILTRPNCLTAKGPAFSRDKGILWDWLNPYLDWDNTFSFHFVDEDEIRFSMGMPYTSQHFKSFISPFLTSEYIKPDTLCLSAEGRSVDRLIIQSPSKPAKYKVLITARHHACEMMANYAIEGIIKSVMDDEWLKSNVSFCFIPFVDIDGVENGDQGKNRIPRDHNRDYSGTSIYTSTAAIKSWIPQWSEKKLILAMDLHCPWIKGKNNENIYIVGSADKKVAEQQEKFGVILKNANTGELKITEKILLPYGTDWNSDTNYADGISMIKWLAGLDGVKLLLPIEFPYSNNEGQTINRENSISFGSDLAKAIKMYILQ